MKMGGTNVYRVEALPLLACDPSTPSNVPDASCCLQLDSLAAFYGVTIA